MSSNSVDFEIDKMKKELTDSIDSLMNQQDEKITFSMVRNLCQGIVDRYYQEGILDRQPIIDVNHIEEIAYFQTMMNSYIQKAYAATTRD